MRNSQYLNDYLDSNKSRGTGKGLTVGSYITYVLRGSAKKYSGKYCRALENSLDREVAAGRVRIGTSAQGRTAYYLVEAL